MREGFEVIMRYVADRHAVDETSMSEEQLEDFASAKRKFSLRTPEPAPVERNRWEPRKFLSEGDRYD